jgi:hypothetical protein
MSSSLKVCLMAGAHGGIQEVSFLVKLSFDCADQPVGAIVPST